MRHMIYAFDPLMIVVGYLAFKMLFGHKYPTTPASGGDKPPTPAQTLPGTNVLQGIESVIDTPAQTLPGTNILDALTKEISAPPDTAPIVGGTTGAAPTDQSTEPGAAPVPVTSYNPAPSKLAYDPPVLVSPPLTPNPPETTTPTAPTTTTYSATATKLSTSTSSNKYSLFSKF